MARQDGMVESKFGNVDGPGCENACLTDPDCTGATHDRATRLCYIHYDVMVLTRNAECCDYYSRPFGCDEQKGRLIYFSCFIHLCIYRVILQQFQD